MNKVEIAKWRQMFWHLVYVFTCVPWLNEFAAKRELTAMGEVTRAWLEKMREEGDRPPEGNAG